MDVLEEAVNSVSRLSRLANIRIGMQFISASRLCFGRSCSFMQTRRDFTLGLPASFTMWHDTGRPTVSSMVKVFLFFLELKLMWIAFNMCYFLSKIYSVSIDLTIFLACNS
jgi:hypothetical protein